MALLIYSVVAQSIERKFPTCIESWNKFPVRGGRREGGGGMVDAGENGGAASDIAGKFTIA